MKKLLFILLLIPYFSFGQNLVPNGDFELGPDSSAEGWGLIVSGPDFWVPTIESPDRIVYGDPLGSRDNDTAQSGLAYVMFWGEDTTFGFAAEAGKATLTSPLQVGKTYKLSYYLDIDDNFYNGPAGIAFRFNNSGDSIPSLIQPNTGQWEYYDMTFIASTASTEVELINIANGINPTLVKVDNIYLQLDTSTVIKEKTKEHSINTYPNPTSGKFTVAGAGEIEVYDLFGRLLLRSNEPQVDMSSFSKGLYFVKAGEATSKLILQ